MNQDPPIEYFFNVIEDKINGTSLLNFFSTLRIEQDPFEFINKLDQELNLNMIEIETDQEITDSLYTGITNGGKKVKVKGFGSKGQWTNYIAVYGNDIVGCYKQLLKTYYNTGIPLYREKLNVLNNTIAKLSGMRNYTSIRNQFSFAGNTTFIVRKTTTKFYPVHYTWLSLTEKTRKDLKWLFQIRFEIYDELLMQTRLILSELENDSYKYSSFQLNKAKGKYIIVEFIEALTARGSYLSLSKDKNEAQKQKNILLGHLFDLFGLDQANFAKLTYNLYNRNNKDRFLKELVGKLDPLNKKDE
ncbi:hypothetical protein [Lacibacter sediminis]|uniref:Replication initiation protein n=1 Tax=Lacibacter sediminis TaxID=2760713 RepID=A0A7G5XFM8_9BACT|nr:hypothetical protein [Lacibacter sediminis]QNA44281.1 hypothetical protein H4075_19795 [Lacibacter sediminis]